MSKINYIQMNNHYEQYINKEEEKNMNNNNNWEVNVQEIDLNEVKKEEQKMSNFIKLSVPTWRTTLNTNTAKIEYRLGNELNFFYVNSKFIYLNKTKEGNFFFTISLLPRFEYDVYLRDYSGHNYKYKLNGQELANKILYWKEKAKNNILKEKSNKIICDTNKL